MSDIMENNNSVPISGGGTDSSSANCCLRKLPRIVVLLFVVLMSIIGIAWLVMKPHVPSFQLTSISVTNFTASGSELTGDYNIELTVINPNNKVEVLVDHLNIKVCHGEVELTELTVSAIYQLEKMTDRKLTFRLESRGPPPKMKHEKVSGEMSADLKKGVVNLNVKVQVRIKFEAGNWPTKEMLLGVGCDDLDVFFSDKTRGIGKLLGIERDCRVSIQS